jgi:glycosyltransferase involved in cell wall biosynthesis
VAQKADMVRTLAEVNVEHISKAFGVPDDRITVLYDGVDLSRFHNTNLLEKKIKKRIVTAGRLIPSKGTDDTIKVFSRVLKRWPDASLVVLGDGPELERLQTLAESLAIHVQKVFGTLAQRCQGSHRMSLFMRNHRNTGDRRVARQRQTRLLGCSG